MTEVQGINTGVFDAQGKAVLHETSRAFGTTTYFTSEGDDITDRTKVGGGTKIEIVHTTGGGDNPVYIDFNIEENITYIHEGYMVWQNAIRDQASLEIVPRLTTVNVEASTEFKLYNNYLVVPSAFPVGTAINVNGKTTVASLTDSDVALVEMPQSEDDGTRQAGYWNADYNTSTHQYENITAAPDGSGIYNMFSVEVVMNRFVNKIILTDTGFIMLQTADGNRMGAGMRLKLSSITNSTDHDWSLGNILTFHRAKTC